MQSWVQSRPRFIGLTDRLYHESPIGWYGVKPGQFSTSKRLSLALFAASRAVCLSICSDSLLTRNDPLFRWSHGRAYRPRDHTAPGGAGVIRGP
jgi:hypothetical protein